MLRIQVWGRGCPQALEALQQGSGWGAGRDTGRTKAQISPGGQQGQTLAQPTHRAMGPPSWCHIPISQDLTQTQPAGLSQGRRA